MRARCLAFATRALFPEVMSGFYTELEIQDTFQDESVNIDVNDEGDIVINNKED